MNVNMNIDMNIYIYIFIIESFFLFPNIWTIWEIENLEPLENAVRSPTCVAMALQGGTVESSSIG